jgi:hypothetical protein
MKKQDQTIILIPQEFSTKSSKTQHHYKIRTSFLWILLIVIILATFLKFKVAYYSMHNATLEVSDFAVKLNYVKIDQEIPTNQEIDFYRHNNFSSTDKIYRIPRGDAFDVFNNNDEEIM